MTSEALLGLHDEDYFARYAGQGYVEAQRRHEARVRLRGVHRVARPPGRLFEVGTAGGYFLDEARRQGWEVAGIEPSAAQARHACEALSLAVDQRSLEDAELPVATFDVACAFHVVEHLPAPRADLERLRAALRPGGALFVEVPNAQSILARRLGPGWPCLGLPYHVNQFGPRSLRALLERAGLRVARVDTIPFSAYYPRAMALRPRHVAHRAVLSLRLHGALGRTHPHKHELLRATAYAPVPAA
jgi:SAM-dependent methyltransferase